MDTDLFIVETNEGTRTVPYSMMKSSSDAESINCAASHNAVFRGKDLTNVYTIDEICNRISNGTFEDLYIGDYFDITISTTYTSNEIVRCVLAGFDIYLNSGDIALVNHHAVIVPKNCFQDIAPINSSYNTALYGSAGASLYQVVFPVYTSALQYVFGEHIIKYRLQLPDNVNKDLYSGAGLKGSPDSNSWCDIYLSLLTENQVYGNSNYSYYDIGIDNIQFPLFSFSPTARICGKNNTTSGDGDGSRQTYWLRNIASSDDSSDKFASIHTSGNIFITTSKVKLGIRPYFLIG